LQQLSRENLNLLAELHNSIGTLVAEKSEEHKGKSRAELLNQSSYQGIANGAYNADISANYFLPSYVLPLLKLLQKFQKKKKIISQHIP